jgi:hypothetical protein
VTPEKIKRKLTTILSADGKGYSLLMREDEGWTLHLQQIQEGRPVMNKIRVCLLALLIGLIMVLPALAQTGGKAKINFKQMSKVEPTGDIYTVVDLNFSTQLYTQLKSMVSNTNLLLRELGITGQVAEIKDFKAEYDDSRNTIRVRGNILGGMKNRGKEWFGEITDSDKYRVVDSHFSNAIILMALNQMDNGTILAGTWRIEFPVGTKNIRFDSREGGLFCEMPPPKVAKIGTADMSMRLQVRKELMSCLYKVYGNPKFTQLWVAKAIVKNKGSVSVNNLRVRFRIPGYSNSWSSWARTPIVYPDQTVVEAYFPILLHNVRELKSVTPAMVEMECSYTGSDGKTVEENEAKPIQILGLNEVMFSSLPGEECTNWFESFNYSPLIGASFVVSTDPIITQFAGMAAKLAGGVGASTSDENALKFMKGVYDLMVANQIKYQSPPGMLQKGVVRQHVKFGRDVLQNRAGTCIDLAILYASTCQAGGLAPGLIMIPGHCFPVIRLPSGKLVAVETTVVSGSDQGAVPFDKAVQIGMKELEESSQKGLIYSVDIDKLRALGIPSPELPSLPPSTLNDWGIRVASLQEGPEPQPQGQAQTSISDYAGGGMKQVTAPNGTFTISIPADWQSQAQSQGAVQGVMAMDPAGSGAIINCQVAFRQVQSLEQFVKTMLLQWQQTPGWQTVNQQNVTISGKPAILLRAKGTPNNILTVADYIFVLNSNNQFLLSMSVPLQAQQRVQNIFRQVTGSWRIP